MQSHFDSLLRRQCRIHCQNRAGDYRHSHNETPEHDPVGAPSLVDAMLGIQFERLHGHVRARLRADEAPQIVRFNPFNPQLVTYLPLAAPSERSGAHGRCLDQLQNAPAGQARAATTQAPEGARHRLKRR
jgi:hypothetical protein